MYIFLLKLFRKIKKVENQHKKMTQMILNKKIKYKN